MLQEITAQNGGGIMEDKGNSVKETKKKSFWGRLFEKVDKKMQESAKGGKCCCNSNKPEDKSCCS